ncbi:thioredoxin [Sphingobacterium hungaricum]|uniref:Thioredoxin n=1 Tax=Sphingobacterium hungaricum TaxID=2082723 RepID=A0A928UXV4_9SPHI|nr:thioredoxin [Sphingobacterium hungaricum]MBE8715246.1 thioredoxin [Sphingobacterium hungaricum]
MASFQDIITKNNLVLVDFSATWCGPCQALAPILTEVKHHFDEKLSVIKIDVDKNQTLSSQYRVQGVPTLILFKDGQQVWRQSGVLQKQELIAIVNQHGN